MGAQAPPEDMLTLYTNNSKLRYTDDTGTEYQVATSTDIGSYLPLAGGTMTGNININGNRIVTNIDGNIPIGNDVTVTCGIHTVALGTSTSADGDNAIAIGREAASASGIALGYQSSSRHGIAIGMRATASGNASTALGHSSSSGVGATAIGRNTSAAGNNSVALGISAATTVASATALGREALGAGTAAIALGYEASASAEDAITIGTSA